MHTIHQATPTSTAALATNTPAGADGDLTLTDLFCGAGGSSTGATAVPGVHVKIAANHWDPAIETHQRNHPNTDHAISDIHKEDPHYFPATDIAWMSPECTKWTVARGVKQADIEPGLFEDPLSDEAAHRSRMLMFDVPRFAEVHRYKAIIVENVVDVATLPKYRPAFELWLQSMVKLGYEYKVLFLNAMHASAAGAPAPQSRDRVYIVFWLKGNRAPDLDKWTRPRAHCNTHGSIQAIQSWKNPLARGRYRAQYVWRCPRVECRNQVVEPAWLPASAAIDWTDLGQRIGDRDKPLADKTMDRIRAGLRRFGPGALLPMEGREGKQPQGFDEPMRTLTTRQETALMISLRGANAAKPVSAPFDTFAAGGFHHALLMRNNTARGDAGQMTTPVTDVMRTLTTAGHQSLLVPTGGSWSDDARPVTDPMRTRTTRESEGLLIPYLSGSLAVPTANVMPTLTTVDPAGFLLTEQDVANCRFRMLHPREIAAGMAFPSHYVILGSKRAQVRQAGNAVCPPAARDLIAAVAESLGADVSSLYELAA